MSDPWKPYIEAARAAGEPFAWVPDYGDSDSLYQQVPVTEASDCGHFEPSPFDLGLTEEPGMPWLLFNGQPVMEGDGGRLVYDCQPETADGCFIEVPGSESQRIEPVPYDRLIPPPEPVEPEAEP